MIFAFLKRDTLLKNTSYTAFAESSVVSFVPYAEKLFFRTYVIVFQDSKESFFIFYI